MERQPKFAPSILRGKEALSVGCGLSPDETAAATLPAMDNQPLLLILVGLATGILVLLLLLLVRRSAGKSESVALVGERERLLTELQSEREGARIQVADMGRLQGRLGALQEELETRNAALKRMEQVLSEQQQRIETESVAGRAAATQLTQSETMLVELRNSNAALAAEAARLQQRLLQLERQHADATAHLKHADAANADMRKFLEQAQENLKGTFAELAGKVFDERGQQFEKNVRQATVQGKVDIEGLLKPFAEKLGEFRTRIDTLYGEEARERSTLLGAVTEMKTLNQTMTDRADALTRALRGNAKVRGDWGELMLESVLRGSGLEEGQHYEKQTATRDEEGHALRPDVIVRLPDERLVVVDSKVNLVAWQDAMNSSDVPDFHSAALRRHSDGLRQHVKELSERNYPRALGEKALDVTIAFVPIEGALSAALGMDGDLQSFAFDRKVVFASPNTLMALLRVVDRLWSRDKSQRQAMQIAEAGSLLLDALNAFVSEFKQVGKKIDDANSAYTTALGRLESSRGVLPRGRRLVQLGVRSRKTLAEELRADTPEILELSQDEAEVDDEA